MRVIRILLLPKSNSLQINDLLFVKVCRAFTRMSSNATRTLDYHFPEGFFSEKNEEDAGYNFMAGGTCRIGVMHVSEPTGNSAAGSPIVMR